MKDDWMESETLQELLENNIQSLYGKCNSPFIFVTPNLSPLDEDTTPYLETLVDINRKGFLTTDSQPSSFQELYISYLKGKYEQHSNEELDEYRLSDDDDVFSDNDNLKYYKCHQYQKAYCFGWIHKYQFELFQKNLENKDYKFFYFNPYTEETQDGYENLTYYEFHDRIYRPTNFFEIIPNAQSELFYIEDFINQPLFQKFKEEMIYVTVTDMDYDTKRNIYEDILTSL
jgi:hypothetical protein